MCHELRNKDLVRIKTIAETDSIDNDDIDNDYCDVDSEDCDSDNEDEALVISAHTESDDENEDDIPSDGQEHIQNKEAMDIRKNYDDLFSLRTRSSRVAGSWWRSLGEWLDLYQHFTIMKQLFFMKHKEIV